MRTTSLVSVLAALISIASTLPMGYSAHQGRGVAARDPSRVVSPPAAARDVNVPRAAPSGKPERRANAPRAAPESQPSKKNDRRASAPRAAPESQPSKKNDRRASVPRAAPESQPSKKNERRGEVAHAKRAQQDQNVFAGNTRWDEDQCPTPLSACPVRGARDADAVECVDLESDLYSCGGCAADDIVCVFLFENP